MSQKNQSISRYSIASVLLCVIFQVSIITLEAKAKSAKNSSIDLKTQHLITILRNDNVSELQTFLDDNKGYDFNKLRNGLWTEEKSTALIDCIILNAYKCLGLLLSQNKFKNKALKTKSSHGFYPLDYALNPTIKTKILDLLVKLYKNPEKYISTKFKANFSEYQENKTKTPAPQPIVAPVQQEPTEGSLGL